MSELKPTTVMQQRFLDAFFSDAVMEYKPRDRVRAAMRIAGYSDDTAANNVTVPLRDHIIEATKDYLVSHGPSAAVTLVEVMSEPMEGARDMLNAAKEILDRGVGVVKVDKMEVEMPKHGIFILPAKQDEDSDGD